MRLWALSLILMIAGCSNAKPPAPEPAPSEPHGAKAVNEATASPAANATPSTNGVVSSSPTVTGVILPHSFSDHDGLEVTVRDVRVTPAGGNDSWVLADLYVVCPAGQTASQTVSWKPYLQGKSSSGYNLGEPSAISPTVGGKIEPNERQKWQIAFKPSAEDFPVTLALLDGTTLTVSK